MMIRLINHLKPYSGYVLVIWLITILAVSSIPDIPTIRLHTRSSDFRLDYLMHFCEYGFLAFLAFLSFENDDYSQNIKKMILITIGLVIICAADEFHQKFIPGRKFNLKDLWSNISGIIAALVICFFLFKRLRKIISGEARQK